ncbi:hypothetical protein L1987_01177 [Smallanthus sonchifolius]|uniref:Uncharacterized protein n=1 Tax=Smallanthus sonchifolius TaxID=185202 RepID=A0ACB9K4A9_9ASTR|nr:hypothetical protein L1987_01177 [Smallanthus sonchifolius]
MDGDCPSNAGRRPHSALELRQIIRSPAYILKAKIGTPAQTLFMALDTSTDMAMVPCTGCVGCTSTPFVFAKSTTFKSLNCAAAQCQQVQNSKCLGLGSACLMNMTYGGSSIAAILAQDNVTLATDSVAGYSFGCIQKVVGTSLPPQGVLGLGRGPLSFISQSQRFYYSTFSYWTVFTRLVTPAYNAVRNEFRRRMGPNAVVSSLGGFDTCYTVPIGKQVPTMTFMFEGAELSMKQDNFLIYSSAGGITCLAMSDSSSLNVIANMQQQNHRILFDLPNSRIGISAESCS